jgi:hypothetical protein
MEVADAVRVVIGGRQLDGGGGWLRLARRFELPGAGLALSSRVAAAYDAGSGGQP